MTKYVQYVIIIKTILINFGGINKIFQEHNKIQGVEKIDNMMTCQEWDKGFIAARENSCENEHFQEMALMGKVASNKDLPKGMRIDVITTEFKGTGEEPHFHLFPANHITKNGKSNNYDLITRVKITENPPNNPDSVQPIVDNPPVPKEYQKAIWEWAFQTKRGVTNWERTKIVWEAQAAAVSYGQV